MRGGWKDWMREEWKEWMKGMDERGIKRLDTEKNMKKLWRIGLIKERYDQKINHPTIIHLPTRLLNNHKPPTNPPDLAKMSVSALPDVDYPRKTSGLWFWSMFEQEKMTELDAGTAIIKHLLGRNPDICRILITEPSSQSSQGPRAQQPIRPAPGTGNTTEGR